MHEAQTHGALWTYVRPLHALVSGVPRGTHPVGESPVLQAHSPVAGHSVAHTLLMFLADFATIMGTFLFIMVFLVGLVTVWVGGVTYGVAALKRMKVTQEWRRRGQYARY